MMKRMARNAPSAETARHRRQHRRRLAPILICPRRCLYSLAISDYDSWHRRRHAHLPGARSAHPRLFCGTRPPAALIMAG